MSTSLRLPGTVMRRVKRVAKTKAVSPHAFMVDAICEAVAAEEAHAEFVAEAERRLAHMKRTGLGVPAEEVFEYLIKKAQGKPAKRPVARKLT